MYPNIYATGRAVETATDTASPYTPYRFTVDEYYRLAEIGILDEDDRVELIDGQILVMEPISSEHGGHTKVLLHLFASRLRDRAILGIQDPIQIDTYNHPQPDVTVCRPREDFYKRSHPGPDDILLIVEVAWTSAARDRHLKVRLYGRAGIPEFWLVDIPRRTLEVYTRPTGRSDSQGIDIDEQGYDHVERLHAGETVRPVAFADVEFRVEVIVSLD